ncbi:MAG: polysaccharide biosynthesis protein [Candidatus Saganbacteria bacterium]|uniref:Polysaccharide biosynthesis protein n=1 Tax=Candidatus Saganbacteria bacterium TaxID=2575572 RepID=A0A833NZ97_UNCSA|nr:MAG: polysaccharide biosynthesis protein [Candidatus Saganbacteria bacterium]
MNVIRRTAKNISSYVLAQIIGYLANFIFFIYTARYLGAGDFGVLFFAIAFSDIFSIFLDLGFKRLMIREIARDRMLLPKYFNNIATSKIGISVFIYCLIITVINILGYPIRSKIIVYIIALAMIFRAFSEVVFAAFQTFEKMEYEAVGLIIKAFLLLIGGLVIIRMDLNVFGFALLYLFLYAAIFIYSFVLYILQFKRFQFQFDWEFIKMSFFQALPFGLIGVFDLIYHWIDTVMLSIMKGDMTVGWYNVPSRLIVATLLIPTAFNLAIFPLMSKYFMESEKKLSFVFEKYFKYLAIIGAAIGISITLLADKIIPLLFGTEYLPSVIALKILIWSAVLVYINSASVQLLISINKQLLLTKIAGFAVILNILLNFILIPKYSYLGACGVAVLSQLFLSVSVFYYASKTKYKIQENIILKTLLPVCLAGFLMGAMVLYFKRFASIWLMIFPGLVIYLLALFLFKVIKQNDLAVFKSIFKEKTIEQETRLLL